jgi:hypothetical protein
MKNEQIITEKELNQILEYLTNSYTSLCSIGLPSFFKHFIKDVDNSEGFETAISVFIARSKENPLVSVHIHVKPIEQRSYHTEEVHIDNIALTFEEFKAIESKATELKEFAKSLNLWKH